MNKLDIEAVKAESPILSVLQDLGLPVVNHRFRCPRPENHKHMDRTPSATVWPDKGTFKCWVCPDVKGDVIDLVRLVRGCSFKEALDYLGRGSASAPPPPPPRQAPPSAQPARARTEADPSMSGTQPRLQVPGVVPVVDPGGSDQTRLFLPSALPAVLTAAGRPVDTVSAPPPPHVSRSREEDPPEAVALRRKILAAFLDLCPPIGGKVARYLQKRRIFRRTWESQGLRMVEDYAGVSRKLAAAFGTGTLEAMGFFNSAGHLRFYRHRLLFPYFDLEGKPVYLQARAIEADVKPKELSMAGPIPIPYNCRLLDGEPGRVYLCEGIIDTLTLIEQGFPAVGVPGAANFKAAWAPLFRKKTVHVAFDHDVPGETGAIRAIDILQAQGVEARRLAPPPGMDLNDWFRKG